MANGLTPTILEDDLPDRLHEAAVASDSDPIELFEERLVAISQWSSEVEDGDREGALAFAVEEMIRTGDIIVDNDDNDDNDEFTDSADDADADSHGFSRQEQRIRTE